MTKKNFGKSPKSKEALLSNQALGLAKSSNGENFPEKKIVEKVLKKALREQELALAREYKAEIEKLKKVNFLIAENTSNQWRQRIEKAIDELIIGDYPEGYCDRKEDEVLIRLKQKLLKDSFDDTSVASGRPSNRGDDKK